MRDIVVVREVAYPREMVWAALTDSRQLGAWLMPNDFAPHIGHRFTFRTKPAPGFDGVVRCEVLELRAPERVAFTWVGGPLETVVSFDLEAVARGTRITLRHAGFDGAGNLLPRVVLGFGWRSLLAKKLVVHLAGVGHGA
ncbi:SRPBCC domain-containing protein [Tabrizicola sp. TH137]|uniref:SRPBCC family protein n=1 Tax=Tabrizicola sp. TH137 TaxID=2067452 RepID=UPI001303F9B0|nr:SRPBCC domain-containing protein [Tabrizicola sp. TH137]